MTYNITLQYRIDADSPIEAQQKAIANDSNPTSVQCREIPTRPQRTAPAPASTPVPEAMPKQTPD